MKKITIAGFYTEPQFRLDISSKVKGLLREKMTEKLLPKANFPNEKIEILELLLNTDGKSETVYISENKDVKSNEYLSFTLWLPYSKIVKNEKTDLAVFVAHFFDGMTSIFSAFDISETDIQAVQNEVQSEIVAHETNYQYQVSENQAVLRKLFANS